MEKTTTITIAGISFSLTENAYAKLSSYLESLKRHFAGEAESAEIMRDIESRIAEKLHHKKAHVITESDITAVIAEIGEASEFDDDTEEPKSKTGGARKLYRDMDNALIGGVCSGIAAYFNIDTLWVRLAFLASIFFGGTGILIYVILWMIVPEAKNAGQKLEMRGSAVDLEGITRMVKERVEETRESGAASHLAKGIRRLIATLFRIFGRFAGVVLVLGSFFTLIGLSIGLGIVAINWNAPFNDFPLRDIVPTSMLIAGFVAGYFVLLIPCILVFIFGLRLVFRRNFLTTSVGFGLLGMWALAIVASGVLAATIAGKHFEYIRTAPEYQEETYVAEVDSFTRINVANTRIVVKSGAVQGVTVEGRARDMDRFEITVEDGTLMVSEKETNEMCIFCHHSTPEVVITTPDLASLEIENGTLVFDEYADTALTIDLSNGILRGSLDADALSITMKNSTLIGNITSVTVSIDAQNSHFNIDGSATDATIKLNNSSFNADGLDITNATLTGNDSYGTVNVTGQYTESSDNSTHIVNEATEEREEN